MRSTFLLVLGLCASASSVVAQPAGSAAAAADASTLDGPIYISHVTVIDTETGNVLVDRTVVISGERIAELKASNQLKPPKGAKVVDGAGKYLIPGLWDMHVHAWNYDSTFPLFVANGVTGVREMFGPPDATKFRAALAKADRVLAPRFYLASPIVDGHPKVWPTSVEVNTPEEARKFVDEQKQKGADFIKVYSRLSRDCYFAIVEESRRQKIPVQGHLPTLVTAWEATNAKQKSFEHLGSGIPLACSSREEELRQKVVGLSPRELRRLAAEAMPSHSDAKCERLFRDFKSNMTWQVPTLTVNRSFGMLNDEQFLRDDRLRFFGGEYRHRAGAPGIVSLLTDRGLAHGSRRGPRTASPATSGTGTLRCSVSSLPTIKNWWGRCFARECRCSPGPMRAIPFVFLDSACTMSSR